jgi:hypothetical protein
MNIVVLAGGYSKRDKDWITSSEAILYVSRQEERSTIKV